MNENLPATQHLFYEYRHVSDAFLINSAFEERMLAVLDRDSLVQLAQELARRFEATRKGYNLTDGV